MTSGELYVCYARDGAGYVRKLMPFLERSGVAASHDLEPPDAVEMDALRRRMNRTSALLVVMTTESATSAAVLEAADEAERQKKQIVGLLLEGRRPFRFNQYEYENVTRGQLPSAEFISQLREAAPGTVSARPARKWLPAVVGAALVVLAVVGGAFWFTRGVGSPTGAPPSGTATATGPTGGPVTTGAAPPNLLPGGVVITSHHDGDTVGHCARIEGAANLDTEKTILFAKMRTSPSDTTWYFGRVGSYRNGFVPAQWAGSTYFGTETGQRYDLFVIVMDVPAADKFWNKHKSKDDSYAFAPAIPPDAQKAAVVRVLQGSMDEC